MHESPILLTGATGYIGSRLLRVLEEGGCAVRCLARRVPMPVPVLTRRLSGLWLGLVTPAQACVGRALVEGLRNPTVVRSNAARETFGIQPMSLREAVMHAVEEDAPTHHVIDTRVAVVDFRRRALNRAAAGRRAPRAGAARAGRPTMRKTVLGIAAMALAPLAGTSAAQDTAGMALLRGRVVDAQQVPQENVAVCAPAVSQCVVTDAGGAFTLMLRQGTYTLELAPAGRPLVVSSEIQLRAGVDTVVDFGLPQAQTFEQTVLVTASALAVPEEVKTSNFLVPAQQIAASAGALQDVARYVQSLPGVAIGTDDFRNDLIVRGGSPLENLYIVDNVEIPNINSFATLASAGGTVSMLDVQLIDNVTFLTGG
jgi:hypothetical protein